MAVPSLIEGVIPLPPVLGLRSRSALGRLYTGEHLSARKISRLIGSSRSAVLDVLSRFGIPPSEGRRKRTGTLPFGFDYLNHQLVKNGAEQAAIRMMRQYRAGGLSLREIAGDLNLNLIPTKESTQNKRYSLMVRQKDCRRLIKDFLIHMESYWWSSRWRKMGRPAYPHARSVLITADAGGSNGSRVRLWKWELQQLATRTGLSITVCYFPPGTSKWNKIEHRLFSYISSNWRGQPLTSLAVIVSLIASTRTVTGLRVRSELDPGRYPDGQTVSDQKLLEVNLARHRLHGDWNYTIHPRKGIK